MKIPLPPIPLPERMAEVARQFVDGTQAPAEPRNAATVVLLRPAEGGPELYLLRRHASMEFAGGMFVFPGGGVDERDFDATVGWAGPSPAQWATRLGTDEEMARALVCAAVRETFEESGVLLAGPSADAVVADTTGDDWEADRVALESRELAMTDFLTRRGLVLRTDLLGSWDGWLTPVFEPKRYRTWFFVAAMPEGQRTRDVSSESSEVTWLSARIAADRAEDGEVWMLPPTYLTCLELGTFDSVDDILEASDRDVDMFTPAVEPGSEGWVLSIPERHRALMADRDRR